MKRILLAVGLVLAVTTSSFALDKGQSEINVYGSIGTQEIKFDGGGKMTEDTITVRTGYGYFITENLSLGGDLQLDDRTDKFGGSKNTTDTFVFDGSAKYHFMPKNVLVPYVGVQLGMSLSTSKQSGASDDTTTTGFAYGAMGGIKWFVSENASFNAELNALFASASSKTGGQSSDVTITDIKGLFGLSYYFGK